MADVSAAPERDDAQADVLATLIGSITVGTRKQYAEQSATWTAGHKTEDELLQRIWNLAGDSLALTDLLVTQAAENARLVADLEAAERNVRTAMGAAERFRNQGLKDAASLVAAEKALRDLCAYGEPTCIERNSQIAQSIQDRDNNPNAYPNNDYVPEPVPLCRACTALAALRPR